ncbi:hypothetical protein [Cognatilysobacter bugurensis]|uniref:Uncharacterized protein n=1 Tax=Cognatilysobacter bugurensis TaxID=543356 RepID=A0A918T0S4_9GAMM|nr:hypothetical protein [Lysobacter bugurensis]GHA79281.1 hypothetical protein GCM10007067_15950 [Lysobacter bugurensis]
MNPNDKNLPDRDASSTSGRERDQEQLDRRSHGGTQNGSTQTAREHHLSEREQRSSRDTEPGPDR